MLHDKMGYVHLHSFSINTSIKITYTFLSRCALSKTEIINYWSLDVNKVGNFNETTR